MQGINYFDIVFYKNTISIYVFFFNFDFISFQNLFAFKILFPFEILLAFEILFPF